MLALLLLAAGLGLSNLAAATGIGASGVSGGTRVRIAVVFGFFEAAMPLLGLVLGHGLAAGSGRAARLLGGAVLIAVGVVSVILAGRGPDALTRRGAPASQEQAGQAVRDGCRTGRDGCRTRRDGQPWRMGRVAASGLALSADNLAAGFALGTYRTGLAVAAVVIGGVSVAMSLMGLELGAKIGAAAGSRSELLASAILIVVGGGLAAGVF